MKRLNHLILATLFITLFVFSSKSQNKPAKYTDFNYGEYYRYLFKWDSAFLRFNRYVNNPDDTLNKGAAYNYMGEIQWRIGDLYGAQESLISAIKTLDPHNAKHNTQFAYSYNLLGNISLDLKLYDEAIGYYDTAMIFTKRVGYAHEVMNGKATALQRKKKFNEAIALYDSILVLKPDDQLLVARTIDNRAKTKWLQNPDYPVLPEFHQALRIRADSQFKQEFNASYAHLSDYYEKIKPDSALWYAEKMRENANDIKNPDDILEAVDKLIRLNSSVALKQYWYDNFKKLNDSIQFLRDTTRSRFASIRYGVEKSKADNLALQQHITKQRVLTVGICIAALALIIALIFWFHRRRQKLKQEAKISIRDSKLKTSQKVHDVVANELYGIMNELEHGKEIEREPLLTRIEELYEKSRDISYEEVGYADDTNYDKHIHELLDEFTNEQTNVFAVGNQPAFWTKVTAVQKNQLLLILREIMTNMKKHSGAGNVVIRFKEDNSSGTINYSDDGKGFPADIEYGNGLRNTVNRIQSLNGEIIFGKSDKGGASIAIRFPLQSSKA
ncbi:MAG TPA: ATP-binding protein [Chitinophagaceae bacterium]